MPHSWHLHSVALQANHDAVAHSLHKPMGLAAGAGVGRTS
jgi:hypothetical protein